MIRVNVPAVGDGLAAGIRIIDNCAILIDCGSQQRPDAAFKKGLYRIDPDVFILSHFHVDHYNGLLQWRHFHQRPKKIKQAFFPRIPEFRQNETFLKYISAMNHWVMGDTTGNMEADFLDVLFQINRHQHFTYNALSSGDKVLVGGLHFEVLWPPRVIDDEGTLKAIRTAISDFEAAMEADETLRRIYESIGERGKFVHMLREDNNSGKLSDRRENRHEISGFPFSNERRKIPKIVGKANESLRRAANHLSLAFHEGNNLLFMGDLEGHEIGHVVTELTKKQRVNFFVIISPHHGTHWQKNLSRIHCKRLIISVGERLFPHVCHNEYKSIAEKCLLTDYDGDIEISVPLPLWHRPGPCP